MINNPEPKKIIDFIHQAIIDGIKKEVEREFEAQKKITIENIDRRKVEVIAGITMDIMSMTDFQNFNDRVIFTIRKEKDEN